MRIEGRMRRARDAFGDEFRPDRIPVGGDLREDHRVERAGHQQRRHPDPGRLLAQVRIEQDALARGDRVTRRRRRVLRLVQRAHPRIVAPDAGELQREIVPQRGPVVVAQTVREASDGLRLHRVPPAVGAGKARRRGDHHQGADAFGGGERARERDHSAERPAHPYRTVRHRVEYARGDRAGVGVADDAGTVAVAGKVHRMHFETGGEPRREILEYAPVDGPAVQQHEGRAAARDFRMQGLRHRCVLCPAAVSRCGEPFHRSGFWRRAMLHPAPGVVKHTLGDRRGPRPSRARSCAPRRWG